MNDIFNFLVNDPFNVVVIFRFLSVCLCFTSLFTLNRAEWLTLTAFSETQWSCFLNCWSFCVQAVALDKGWCVDLGDWNAILNLDVFLCFFSPLFSLPYIQHHYYLKAHSGKKKQKKLLTESLKEKVSMYISLECWKCAGLDLKFGYMHGYISLELFDGYNYIWLSTWSIKMYINVSLTFTLFF